MLPIIILLDLADRADADFDAVVGHDALAGAALWMLKSSRAPDFAARLIARTDLLAPALEEAVGGEAFEQRVIYAWAVADEPIDVAIVSTRRSEHLPKDTKTIMRTLADQLIENGRIQARQSANRDFLTARFGSLPESLIVELTSITDASTLDRFITTAGTAGSLAEFERAARSLKQSS